MHCYKRHWNSSFCVSYERFCLIGACDKTSRLVSNCENAFCWSVIGVWLSRFSNDLNGNLIRNQIWWQDYDFTWSAHYWMSEYPVPFEMFSILVLSDRSLYCRPLTDQQSLIYDWIFTMSSLKSTKVLATLKKINGSLNTPWLRTRLTECRSCRSILFHGGFFSH